MQGVAQRANPTSLFKILEMALTKMNTNPTSLFKILEMALTKMNTSQNMHFSLNLLGF